MKDLKRIDLLFLIYLTISTLTLAFAWDPTIHSPSFIWVRVILVASLLALIGAEKRTSNSVLQFLRAAYPILLSGYFYSETVHYNKLFFTDLDPWLITIETAIFKMQPSLEFAAFFSNKLVSELMYFSYFSFYLLIIGFTLLVFLKKETVLTRLPSNSRPPSICSTSSSVLFRPQGLSFIFHRLKACCPKDIFSVT